MKTKDILVLTILVLIGLISYGVYELYNFSLFDGSNNIKPLSVINIPNKDYELKIYYVPSDATIQSYIQVRKIEHGIEQVIANYERFNYLNKYTLSHKLDTLILFISDTSGVNDSKKVKLKLP